MKILIPEDISDITLGQYQRYIKLSERTDLDELNFNKRIIEIFCGVSFKDTDKIPAKDYLDIIQMLHTAINKDSEFVNRFEMNGVEFGMIPNFDNITFDEYIDLSNYGQELYIDDEDSKVNVESLHKLMAVLFRPITTKDSFGNYSIVNYNGTKDYAEVMKGMPMNVVNGSIVFFCNLSRELQEHILKSTEAEELKRAQKQVTTLANGIGMQH